MTWLDYAALLFIIVLGYQGFRHGAIASLLRLAGAALSIYLSIRYYAPVADWLIATFAWPVRLRVFIFVLAFVLVYQGIIVLFWAVQKVTTLITWLPIISSVNRIVGLLFGSFKAITVLAVILFFVERYPVSDAVMTRLAASSLAPTLSAYGEWITPLYPEAITTLESTVLYVEGRVP